jgi:hypothetical protein
MFMTMRIFDALSRCICAVMLATLLPHLLAVSRSTRGSHGGRPQHGDAECYFASITPGGVNTITCGVCEDDGEQQ